MGKQGVIFSSLIVLVMLTACGTNRPANTTVQNPSDLSYMTYKPGLEVLTVDEFLSRTQTDSSSIQAGEYPDLTDTNGVSVMFSHTFEDGFQVDLRVTDGIVSSGDMLLGSYAELLEGVRAYEAYLAEGTLSSQAAFTTRYCKTGGNGLCFDFDGDKWTNSIVRYVPPNPNVFTPTEVGIINGAIQEIESKTDVDFQVASSGDRIWFNKDTGGGCTSWLGRAGGLQRINLQVTPGYNCVTPDTVRHELGHALGLIHEHQREDRDTYVTVFRNNIKFNEYDNFQKITRPMAAFTFYDTYSLMHYQSDAFAKPGFFSMQRKNGSNIARNLIFSASDIRLINTYY